MTFLRMDKDIAHVDAVMAGIGLKPRNVVSWLDATRGFDRDSSSNRYDTWRAFVVWTMEKPRAWQDGHSFILKT